MTPSVTGGWRLGTRGWKTGGWKTGGWKTGGWKTECLAALFVAALACLSVRLTALDVSIDDADLRRAIRIARGDSRALAAFHRPYMIQVASGDLQQIEVISELRRAVLSAEDRNRIGEPEDAAMPS